MKRNPLGGLVHPAAHMKGERVPLRLHHVGVVVTDLPAATAFFVGLGLAVEGEAAVGGAWVDRVIGLSGVQSDIVMLVTPDGHGRVELSRFRSPQSPASEGPASANTLGIRHLSFEVDDLEGSVSRLRELGSELIGDIHNYEGIYLLCYVRGPEGIIVELAQRIG